MSKVTIKLETSEPSTNTEDYAPNPGETMKKGKGRKRNRREGKRRRKEIKRQKEHKDPFTNTLPNYFFKDPVTNTLPDCFLEDELEKVELRSPCAPMAPKNLQEETYNTFSSQSSESDDEFDPWASIFADTCYTPEEFSLGSGRTSTSPRFCVEEDSLTWAQRHLSSV